MFLNSIVETCLFLAYEKHCFVTHVKNTRRVTIIIQTGGYVTRL